ncbi:MAG: DUF302 domain-containing protein [Candidatus Aenigmarchaeota archaeon]|nr:DUF302 domain-containing protein [Candidatus Aenigmarchaeota archaeon]
MNVEDFAYVVDTRKNFEETVVSVLRSIEKKGWSIFNIYDLKERLAAKGFEHERMKIIEICSAKYADRFLKKNKLVSLCMPCKINVLEYEDSVRIVGMRPSIMVQFFEEISESESKEVESELKEIIDGAK